MAEFGGAAMKKDGYAYRPCILRVLPSISTRAKERLGNAQMFVDETGGLNIQCEDLGVAMRIVGPGEDSKFEFAQVPPQELPPETIATLSHRGPFFRTSREWNFYAVMEHCSCKLFSTVGKTVNAISSTRSVGFAKDRFGAGRKVVIFKEKGHFSPIFELNCGETHFLIARGTGSAARPSVADAIKGLAPADDAINWVAPAQRQPSSKVDTVDLLNLGDEEEDDPSPHSPIHQAQYQQPNLIFT